MSKRTPSPTSKAALFLAFGLAAASSVYSGISFAAEGLQIETFKTHSRLIVGVDEGVPSEIKNTPTGFELTLKGIGLSDLGAPLGEEDRWQAQFKELSDTLLAGVTVEEVPGGVKILGKWKFPQGAQALAKPEMETFDFRQANPSHLVLDFWLKKGPTLSSVLDARKRAEKAAAVRLAEKQAQDRAARRIASEKARAEIEDVGRFCRQPLSESNDAFLQFLPVHQKVAFKRWFPMTTPDAGFDYFEPKSKEKDAQYVRLALDLYRQGKPALVIRTLDFFESETPHSSYLQQMRFLRANALVTLGMTAEADAILRTLMLDAAASPVALYSAMYLAGKQVEKADYLASTDTFLWLVGHYPTHRLAWVFHLGAAESLYSLKQTERAAKEYQWVIENGPDGDSKAEAALRLGDMYMERFEYDRALAGYFQGIHYFKAEAASFPIIHINRAEALYGLGQYDRAREAFELFLKDFPSHPAGWRATFRLGEIYGRKPQEGDNVATSRSWFYETVNRYPFTPGATLARMRLIPCGDHGGFDLATTEKFFSAEGEAFDGKGEVSNVHYRSFRSLAHVRALIMFGKETRAVDLATQELQNTADQDVHDIMLATLDGIFRKSVLHLLDEGKKYEAIAFYKDKMSFLPRPSDGSGVDPDYLLRLSEAASDLGMGELARKINDHYGKILEARERAAASATGRGLAASEKDSDLDAQLKASEEHFALAKALWVSSGFKPDAVTIARIREHLGAVREESRFAVEREIMLGLLDERDGKFASALTHAVRAELGQPTPRMDAWVASLQARAGDPKVALEMYRNLERHLKLAQKTPAAAAVRATPEFAGIPLLPSLEQVLLAQGELLEKQGTWGEAATTYARAMEAGLGGNEAVYEYARALLKGGSTSDRARAIATLEKLGDVKFSDVKPVHTSTELQAESARTDGFWKKLARETLADEKSRQKVSQ